MPHVERVCSPQRCRVQRGPIADLCPFHQAIPANTVLGIILVCKKGQAGRALEYVDSLAICNIILKSGNHAERIDIPEPLLPARAVNDVDLMRDVQLFYKHEHFGAVDRRCWGCLGVSIEAV
jgi:hypothetical protein